MAAGWRNTVDQVGMGIRELFSSLRSELGAGLALDPSGLLLLISAGLGLLITTVLWISVRRGSAKASPENIAPEAGKPPKPRAEEPKKRSRKRAGDKKLQRNGLLSPEEELKPVEPQNQNQDPNESPDPAGGKSDKGKKNKKKVKAPAKETKSPTMSERKEPEEVGSWETKVSNREKRQQRRKDKGPADGSPGGVEPNPEPTPTPAPEEPQTTVTPTAGAAKPNKTPKSNKNPSVPTPAAPKRGEPPPAEATPAPEVKAPVSQIWEGELNVSRSGWRDLGVSVPGVHTWNSVSLPCEHQEPEPSLWPQDMEGSWTIVDRSQIPVSFHGLSAGVETQVVPDLSWPCHTPVDDEWSGINSASADPGSDWRAPPEEWGNYEDPAGGAVLAEEPQESDPEKDKDEAAAAPGSGKAKKKKKRKKKVDEAGAAAQVEAEVCVSKDRSASASNPAPSTNKESVPLSAPPRVTPKPPEPEAPPNSTAPPTQKKPEESWESPKQVKKKKARRET